MQSKVFETRDSAKLYLYEAGNPESNTAIFLLPGLLCSGESYFNKQVQAFSRYHIFSLDLRGHGRSDPDSNNGSVLRCAADDVIEILESLRSNHDQLYCVGHSLGGGVVLNATLTRPDLVDKLVLLNTAPTLKLSPINTPFFGAVLIVAEAHKYFSPPIDRLIDLTTAMYGKLHDLSGELAQSISNEVKAAHEKTAIEEVRELADRKNSLENRLHKIAKPTLVVGGYLDIIALYSGSITLHNKIPDSKLHRIFGGHYLNITHSKLINKILMDFFTKQVA